MKKISKILSIGLLSMMAVSCNDWLDDVRQTQRIDEEIVFEDEKSIDLYVNGFYTWISKYSQFGDKQFSNSITESMTDIFKYAGSNLTARAGQANQYAELAVPMTADNGGLYACWTTAYESIRRINQFLTLQEKYAYGKYSESRNIEWEAQARFFRAFIYFQLAKRHGGVILYDALPAPDGQKALSTEDETWDFIEQDLDFCIKNLPVEWNAANKGRVTKYAAFAFKSRCMLYAQRWQKAYDACDSIVKSGKFGLVQNYADAWKGNNKESILWVDYNANLGPCHNFDLYYSPSCDYNGATSSACGACPTQELVETYESKTGEKVNWSAWHDKPTTTPPPYDQLEPRFAATVLYPGCTWKGRVLDLSVQGPNVLFFNYGERTGGGGETVTGYALRKLLDENLTDLNSVKSSQSWVEIRYAEVLLNKAEAAYRLDRIADAQDALNEVRARVHLPKKESTGEQFWNDYRNERKVELAFEGQLFWDMNRWRLSHIEYNNYRRHGIKVDNGTYTYVTVDNTDLKFDAKCYILPVPAAELKDNLLVEQYDNWK